jgi:hypothetical protein
MRRVVQMGPLLPLPLGDFEGLSQWGGGPLIPRLARVDASRVCRAIV